MGAKITPEHLTVVDGNGKLLYGDLYLLTAAQMGANLKSLLEVRPNATFTPEDLAGYHAVQYGVGQHYPEEALMFVEGFGPTNNENFNYLREVLPRVLGEVTVGAIAERIVLGNGFEMVPVEVDPSVEEYFKVKKEPNHRGLLATSLYPKTDEGMELEYHERSKLVEVTDGLGSIRDRVREIYVDFLTVGVPGDASTGVILATDAWDNSSGVKSITLA